MSAIEEQSVMANKILKGELGYADVVKELERISAKYGEDCFNCYPVKRKERPWSEKDLEELRITSACGAGSRDFFLYMAEVSEEVYSKKAFRKRVYICISIVVLIIAAIMICKLIWR